MADDVPTPTITARAVEARDPLSGARHQWFVADGPDGHAWLLKRTTEEAALVDGLAYFLATRTWDNCKWVLS